MEGAVEAGQRRALPDELAPRPAGGGSLGTRRAATNDLRTLADVERDHVLRVLEATGGSQAEAARIFGIARNTLWRKLQTWS